MGLRDVVHAARPIGQALLCLSIYANRSIKLKPGLLACPAMQYNKIPWLVNFLSCVL